MEKGVRRSSGSKSFVDKFMTDWQRQTLIWALILVVLSSLQILVLHKAVAFSIFHSFLIASLVTIS
jgi:hypothetical protein